MASKFWTQNCSLHQDQIVLLDGLIKTARAKGWKVSRNSLIRYALDGWLHSGTASDLLFDIEEFAELGVPYKGEGKDPI